MYEFTEKNQKIKDRLDRFLKGILILSTLLSASVIVIIVLFLIQKGIQPFLQNYFYGPVNLFQFMTGMVYFTQEEGFGIFFAIINTFIVVLIALVIAVPISILTALFVSKIASKKWGNLLKSVIELLSSIPSIIYGIFGASVITTLVKGFANTLNISTYGGLGVLSSALLLAMMIIPTITILSITAMNAVPQEMINNSLALGASKMQTNLKIVLLKAKSGIFAGIILGVGRALGEATAVSLVCGNSKIGISFNPFDKTSTLTSLMLLGMKESSGVHYDIKFSIGLVLMGVILLTNTLLHFIKKRVGSLDE